jgi:hypothetical protein
MSEPSTQPTSQVPPSNYYASWDRPPAFQDPPKRRKVWPWIAGAVFAVAILGVGTFALLSTGEEPPSGPVANEPAAAVRIGGACTGEGSRSDTIGGDQVRCASGRWVSAEPAEAPIVTPELSNFELTVKVKEKQCFGSAGCHVTFEINLGAAVEPDDAATFELTYEVAGPEDGPLVGTMEITGNQYTVEEHFVSTPRKSTKLTVKATDIVRVS